ncbi:MAG: DoxX family protein [Chloroflexi bacterium]|nr:DoxX family protein [Chloroflexota bacterium]
MFKSLGHMLLASMFVFGGANTFTNPDPRAVKVSDAGIPQAREAAILNGAVMVGAGIALGLEIAPKFAALVLIGTLIPTTFVGHPFWKEENPASRAMQQTQFVKNMAMLGGLLLVLAEKGDQE